MGTVYSCLRQRLFVSHIPRVVVCSNEAAATAAATSHATAAAAAGEVGRG